MGFVFEDLVCTKASIDQTWFIQQEASNWLKCKKFSFAVNGMSQPGNTEVAIVKSFPSRSLFLFFYVWF